jgi:four helix bundle protein
MEKPFDLKLRTKLFSLAVLNMIEWLPHSRTLNIIHNQLGRAALSVGANYRVVSRAKSNNDFINKLKIVEEELDECLFFLELLKEKSDLEKDQIQTVWDEGNELLSIVVASIVKARKR